MPQRFLALFGAAVLAAAPLTSALAADAAGKGGYGAACFALRWTTLGTAGGPVPTPDRAEPANLLVAGGASYLVDTGDGSVNQLARVGIDLGQIAGVFISHPHHDHTGGLSAVIGLRWMNQFPGPLTVYGPTGTREIVEGIVASLQPQARVGFGLGVADRPPAASVSVVELNDGDTVKLGGLAVTAVVNSHFDHPGERRPKEPQSLSLRFDLGSRSITYTGDTGQSAAVTRLARGTDLLVSEIIDLERIVAEIRHRRAGAPPEMLAQMEQHLSAHHLRADAVGAMARDAGVRHLVLTHFAIPGALAASEPDLRGGIRASYAGPVDLARDLSSFDVGCN